MPGETGPFSRKFSQIREKIGSLRVRGGKTGNSLRFPASSRGEEMFPAPQTKPIMKTTILCVAALVALPLGAIATPAAPAVSAVVADEDKTADINLEISGMR